jgi:hypothetical protein
MSQSSKSLLLEEEIGLLVKHFGVQRVRAALTKVSNEGGEEPRELAWRVEPRNQKTVPITIAGTLESIRESDQEKYQLLSEFLRQLKDRQILPESQDIRHFAQIVGLKEISGKSRKDMVPKLMRFLMNLPIERLQTDIQSASTISEQQRQMGFSVLTDKLLGKS